MTLYDLIIRLEELRDDHRAQAAEWFAAWELDGSTWDCETSEEHTEVARVRDLAIEELARLEGLEK